MVVGLLGGLQAGPCKRDAGALGCAKGGEFLVLLGDCAAAWD